jgi:RNA polymerase sigma-32 factor
LSKEEEYILAKNFKEKNDIQAAKKLIESNINYVIKIARNYSGYGITIKDLVQEGLIGLIKAVKNFDPEKKHRLISFAIYWIKSEIQEYIIRNLRIVKIASTKTQKRLFFNLKKFKKINWLNTKEKLHLSNFLRAKKKEIENMELKLNNKDISLTFNQNDEEDINIIKKTLNIDNIENENDPLISIEKNNWDNFVITKFKKAFKKLDKRSQEIIKKRWLNKNQNTLKNLAESYNISSERIRQIENNAIKKLKKLIEADI